MPELPVLVGLGVLAAGGGALGGIGGALLLVPVLVLVGVDASTAAPLGLLTVAAGSLAAAPRQLAEGLVHHRLGVVLETGASLGVVAGAALSGALPASVLSRILAVLVLGAGLAALRRGAPRNLPHPEFAAESAGEWPGTLGGAYRSPDGLVPYMAHRTPLGWGCTVGAGLVSGLAGIGGGFIKTPVMREIMSIPVKVAAATSTFTVGITAAAGLVVFAAQGRIELRPGAAVVTGALIGGAVGAVVQERLSPVAARRVLGVLLIAVALAVAIRG